MKILVIGSGGREHALAWKLAQSPRAPILYCAPGNAGMARLAQCLPIPSDDIPALLSFVKEKQIDKFLRTEDLTLGNETSVSIGRTGIPVTRGVERFELNVARSDAFKFLESQYLFIDAEFQTLFDKDTITSFSLRYYNKSLKSQSPTAKEATKAT